MSLPVTPGTSLQDLGPPLPDKRLPVRPRKQRTGPGPPRGQPAARALPGRRGRACTSQRGTGPPDAAERARAVSLGRGSGCRSRGAPQQGGPASRPPPARRPARRARWHVSFPVTGGRVAAWGPRGPRTSLPGARRAPRPRFPRAGRWSRSLLRPSPRILRAPPPPAPAGFGLLHPPFPFPSPAQQLLVLDLSPWRSPG